MTTNRPTSDCVCCYGDLPMDGCPVHAPVYQRVDLARRFPYQLPVWLAIGGVFLAALLDLGCPRSAEAQEPPPPVYRVAPLDIQSDEAIARCADEEGLAGWLQHIDRKGQFVGAADVYCAVKQPPAPEPTNRITFAIGPFNQSESEREECYAVIGFRGQGFMVAAPPKAVVCLWFRDLAAKKVKGRLVFEVEE